MEIVLLSRAYRENRMEYSSEFCRKGNRKVACQGNNTDRVYSVGVILVRNWLRYSRRKSTKIKRFEHMKPLRSDFKLKEHSCNKIESRKLLVFDLLLKLFQM